MVFLYQNLKSDTLQNTLHSHGKTNVRLNRQMIENDIQKFERDLANLNKLNVKNKRVTRVNLIGVITYLKSLQKYSEMGTIQLSWNTKDKLIKSSPIELLNVIEYGVNAVDYVDIYDEKIVSVDYKRLADVIAYEMMIRDLGETIESMEEKLKDLGIFMIYSSDELAKYFDKSPYLLSKLLRVSESPYLNHDTRKLKDYFGEKEFPGDTYRQAVDYSCKRAMAIVVDQILKKIKENKIPGKLLSINSTEVCFIVTGDIDDDILINAMGEKVCIRAFGRRFEVVPEVQIY